MNGTEVKQYDCIYKFIDEWIEKRLSLYELRKQKVLIEIVKQYIMNYNYSRFLEENV